MSRFTALPFSARALAIAPLALAVSLAGCKKEVAAPAKPTPKIRVAHPLEQQTMDWDEYTGRVEAIQQVDIRSRVSGYINTISFTEGAVVKQGDLLFVIDPLPYQAELARAEAELERAKAQSDLAKAEFERARKLIEQKVISIEEFDAKAASASQASSNVRSAEAAAQSAKLSLSYCHITAPVDGRVSLAKVTVGNLVQPGGEILTTIVSQNPMYVYIDADELSYLRYQGMSKGKKSGLDPQEKNVTILLALANETGWPHEGAFDFFDNRVDPNTGTIRMRAVFENKDNFLTPGLFARVRVPGSQPYQGMLLPDSAINTDQSQKYVLTVNADNKVEYKKVELGPLNDGFRVIKSGLSAQDRVVLAGFHAAPPGATVEPQLEKLELKTPDLGYNLPAKNKNATLEAAAQLASGLTAPAKDDSADSERKEGNQL
jgi:multidrug efflux system membrane fusion protein